MSRITKELGKLDSLVMKVDTKGYAYTKRLGKIQTAYLKRNYPDVVVELKTHHFPHKGKTTLLYDARYYKRSH